ncbi:hypothetical protein V1291_004867 [Nitrobacteraceae bacterium AZCC 1564]
MPQDELNHLDQAAEDRRKFLASCGKFAAITPPAITLLLSTSLNSTAVAQSAGNTGNHRNGNGNSGNNSNSGNHGNVTTTTETAIAAIAAITAITATTATTATLLRQRKR